VLAFLCTLSLVVYLDRICISQAVGPIQQELGIDNVWMGYVLSAFTLAYGLFEIPTGHWGDRYGSRGVLTRIVLWWSAFTALTGAATGLAMLLVVRFLFGAGEAGAMPNLCRVVARWFPPGGRGRAQGLVVTSAQVGGAIAPVATAYLIRAAGWRWAFALFGLIGAAWAAVFFIWYRDNPAEHPAVNAAERDLITAGADHRPPGGHDLTVPWGQILGNANVWLMGLIMACISAVAYMYFTWYPRYLQDARQVEPVTSGWLAGMVLAGGAVGGVLGGLLGDWLFRLLGYSYTSRRWIGGVGLVVAANALWVGASCDNPVAAASWTALANLSANVQLAAWWAVVTDISGRHIGVMFGLMNSLGVPGAFVSPIFLGYLTDHLARRGYEGRARWDPAFAVYAVILLIGAACWVFVDPSKKLADPSAHPADPGKCLPAA
jgi:sugar phosphate permease